MALREEFENSGNWLFKWRSYLPIILLALFIIAMRNYHFPRGNEKLEHTWEFFCLAVSFFGLGIRILTIGHVNKRTSGRNTTTQIADSLNTTGIYSVVRHPLYLGNFFMCLGIALLTCSLFLTIIYALVFWVYYERIMFAEEAFLRDKFGDRYLTWAKHTPAFIPNFKNYSKSELRFSFKNVLRREYNGFFAVVFVFFIFNIIGHVAVKHLFIWDRIWIINLCSAFCIWMILRTLKKKTTLLEVQGR